MADERVMIFIDGSNFYHNLKFHGFTTRIDFKKLSDCLAKNRKHVRTYYYNTPLLQENNPDEYKKQQTFFDRLKRTPYLELKLGYFLKKGSTCKSCGDKVVCLVEKGCDVSIAVDMMDMAYKNLYDTSVLVSSDGDLVRACQCVKDLGKHVENAYFQKGSSRNLLDVCDVRTLVDGAMINTCKI
jgi:uncharacterized LabA/DUF88 family protein